MRRDDVRLVAVVELVSPGNKDRPETRLAFASKSAAYLQRGVGLVVVDIVTERHFNLHNELLPLLDLDSRFAMPDDPPLYAVAYRPIPAGRRQSDRSLAGRPLGRCRPCHSCRCGLRGFRAVPLDLEANYEDACHRDRI